MLAKDFWYELPPGRIAQEPAKPRDSSKLMVLDRTERSVKHVNFFDLPNFLKPGDLLVANDSKVFRARLKAKKSEVGSISRKSESDIEFEIFLLRPEGEGWIAMAKPGRKLSVGDVLRFTSDVSARIADKMKDGTIKLSLGLTVDEVFAFTDAHGEVPTPPYIEHTPTDPEDYQTVYAKNVGSAAAPTAGFHFTPELIEKLKIKGIEFATVTLHVGLGTFRPIKTKNVEDHVMHEEWIDVPDATIQTIEKTKHRGGRVIAVGTTTVRALESAATHPRIPCQEAAECLGIVVPSNKGDELGLRPFRGFTNLFMKPGADFKIVDALITNLHLPGSTLLVLVSAFAQVKMREPDAGRKFMLDAYYQAIAKNYRFFSFGDAMLIV